MEICTGIGCLSYSNEKQKSDLFFNLECAAKGKPYNKLIMNQHMLDAIPIISRLISIGGKDHRKVMGECCKDMISAGVEGIEPPNYKDIKTITETVHEKYGLIKKKTRAYEKTVPNPDFEKIESLISGEKYIFIESFRSFGDDDNKDWENDKVHAVTESGRLLLISYEVRRYYRSKSKQPSIGIVKEIAHSDRDMNVLMGIMIAQHIGQGRFEEICDEFCTDKQDATAIEAAAKPKERVKTKEELEKEAEKAKRKEELKQKFESVQPDEEFVYVPKYDLEMKEHAYLQAQFDALSKKEIMLGLRTLPVEQRNPEYIRESWKNEDLAKIIFICKKQGK